MAAFPTSALISAAGGIASSLFGKPKTISPAQQIRSTVKGARAAGIHPLAALGAGAQYQQLSSGANAGSAIGAGLQKAAAVLANQKTEAELDALRADATARRAQAELYTAQSRTILHNAQKEATSGPARSVTPLAPAEKRKEAPTLPWFGMPLKRDASKFASGQEAQDEFGEPGEWIMSLPSLGDAMSRNPYAPVGIFRLLQSMGHSAYRKQSK